MNILIKILNLALLLGQAYREYREEVAKEKAADDSYLKNREKQRLEEEKVELRKETEVRVIASQQKEKPSLDQ